MKNPSAAEGSGAGVSEQDCFEVSAQEDRLSQVDLTSVDEGIVLLTRYDAMFGELLAGLGRLPMPGR